LAATFLLARLFLEAFFAAAMRFALFLTRVLAAFFAAALRFVRERLIIPKINSLAKYTTSHKFLVTL
jgi:hypothetical protein